MDPDKVEARCAKKVSRESEKASGFCSLPRDSATLNSDQFPQIENRLFGIESVHLDSQMMRSSIIHTKTWECTAFSTCKKNYENQAQIK